MKFKTVNPATEEVIAEHETLSRAELTFVAQYTKDAFYSWKETPLQDRTKLIKKLAEVLLRSKQKYAQLMTIEMGKPIKNAIAEIEKCAWAADVYADNAKDWLKEEIVDADGKKHAVVFEPLGVVLAIMPWNFPFWQALRCAIPALITGNTMILKHSNQVPQCALAIEDIFRESGFPENVFRTIIADHQSTEELAASDTITAISLTGSTEAGMKFGEIAGRTIKKVVLELGGSDPFIILEDADIAATAKQAAASRTINAGQSCISAKRFIVHEKIEEQFTHAFAEEMQKLVVGNPADEKTQIGPLINHDAVNKTDAQVNDALQRGAKVVCGGSRLQQPGFFYPPTVLVNVQRNARVVKEEVFAPIGPIIKFKTDDEAIMIANELEFGLGASVWTKDLERGERIARKIDAGTVFINSIVKSDPRMPFGGTKKSGLGRELSHYGLKEFVNIKGINVYEHQ
ncbi:MAG TPA: NAD-dependent succinate-semialdehyde dehydrogenase [Candidatus Nanoarchaeia archaeon]|nr:NAD-dependent succinate-semialdehyde dehydrogenase [Candidatus Nanoarchaeia archaeon]